jgi:glycosyltransferase involved in cell wall biosynthesis
VWPEVRRGGERYLDDLAWYLRGAGHDVDVITGTALQAGVTSTSHGDDVRLKQLRGLKARRVDLTSVETFGVRALPVLLRRRYDVVHSLVPTAALSARVAGQRVVFTLLGHPTPELLARKPVKARVLRAVMRTAAAVTALSENVASDVAATLGRRPLIIAPGVRTGTYAPAPRTDPPSILFASAMRPEKGLDVLLRAFGALASRQPDVRLVLCGPGDPDWAFSAAADALSACRDRIDVVGAGRPEDLPARYAAASVTALPSRNEAFGLVLAESLASGTPVVGCVGGGADDIVTPDVGRIVPHGDADGLAAALEEALRLARDPAIAHRCVARAQTWDWKTSIGPQHETLYRDVASTLHRRGRSDA